MKGIKQFLSIALVGLIFICKASFALPFSITPSGTLPVVVDNVTDSFAFYTVTNITNEASPGTFVKFLPPNVKQVIDKLNPALCGTTFTLNPGQSCLLKLVVAGPVNASDPDPQHHLFVCRMDGKTCAGTASELNVTMVNLVAITVTPALATIPVGTTQAYTATGTFSDGSSKNLPTVTWASSNMAVATINSSGVATGLTVGSTHITATLLSVTSPFAVLNVSAAALTSITVTPFLATIPVGTDLQYTAIGRYTDGSVADITTTVTWSSSTANATIIGGPGVNGGLATGVSVGSSNITATLGLIASNTAVLTISAAVLDCITISPNPASVAVGADLQFTAIGTYSDGSTSDITSTVTWSSSVPAKATIGSGTGLATGVAVGSTTIGATLSGITAVPVQLNVAAALISVSITPLSPASIPVGGTSNFTATANFNGGVPSVDITSQATWSSSNPDVATINSLVDAGEADGISAGTVAITAVYQGITSNSVNLTVT